MPHYAFRLDCWGGSKPLQRPRVFAEDTDEAIEIAVSWAKHERRFWDQRADLSTWPLIIWALGKAGRPAEVIFRLDDARPNGWVID